MHLTFHIKNLFRILLTSSILFLFISCENDLSDLPDFDKNPENIDIAENVTILLSREGVLKVEIAADTFYQQAHLETEYIDLVGNVSIQFYTPDLEKETTLTGDFARFYTEENNAIVQNNVVASNLEGDSLFTEELVWNNKLRKFFTEKEVKIIMKNEVSYGTGLEANEDLSWIRIHQQKGSIPVETDDFDFE